MVFSPRAKRVLMILCVGVLLLAGALFGLMRYAFGRNVPLPARPAVLRGGIVLVPDGFVASYLVPTRDGRAFAIDAGNDPGAHALQHALQDHHWTLEAFVITHGHGDHIGGCKSFPNVPVYALGEEVDLIEGRVGARSLVGGLSGVHQTGVRVTHRLADRVPFEISGVSILPMRVPGHTQGSAAYLVNGVLFVGDSVNHVKSGGLSRGPWFFSDEHEQIVGSMAALASVRPADELVTFAPAHSAPVEGPWRWVTEVQ